MAHSKSSQSNSKLSDHSKSKKRQKKVPKKITESYLHNSGLYYLERFAASKNHFRTVMLRKVKRSCFHHKDQNYDDCVTLVENLIIKFEELGFLNDDSYIKAMITSLRQRGLSKRMILNKMQLKGINPDQTAEYLEKFNAERDLDDRSLELYGALKFIKKKKLGPFLPSTKQEDSEKSLAKLARQGFSYDIAKTALDKTMDEAEEILSRF